MEGNEKLDNNLGEIVKQKEEADKRLLTAESFIGVLATIIFLGLVFIASFVEMPDWLRILLIIIGLIEFIISVMFAVKIEQTAGYYECKNCHNKYVPTFNSVLWAPHINRTRYMKCPKCHEKSWQKRLLVICKKMYG